MTLQDLTADEKIALAGLVRMLVRADGEFSSAEVSAVTQLGKELGSMEFWKLMSLAQQTLEDANDVMDAVAQVERPEVREWIYGVLIGLAAVDGIDEAEGTVLDWVMQVWDMK